MEQMNMHSMMAWLLGDLESAKQRRREADEEMKEILSILQTPSGADKDPNAIAHLVQRQNERVARDMFDLIRPALRANKTGSTSQDITNCVLMTVAKGCFEQITYATSVALQLMVESGEINHFANEQGEKLFRLKTSRTKSKRRREAPSHS